MKTTTRVPIWDVVVRLLHAVLIVSLSLLVVGLLTSWAVVHQPAGYTALGAVLLRTVWGFVGRNHARFGDFVHRPATTWAYAKRLAQGRAPRHVGHNPLGGWMVIALLLCVAALGVTGWLYTTDMFWGSATLEFAHQILAWTLLGLVTLHVLAAMVMSWHHRENLVAAMIHGDKHAPSQQIKSDS
jgi:cytochrome b